MDGRTKMVQYGMVLQVFSYSLAFTFISDYMYSIYSKVIKFEKFIPIIKSPYKNIIFFYFYLSPKRDHQTMKGPLGYLLRQMDPPFNR